MKNGYSIKRCKEDSEMLLLIQQWQINPNSRIHAQVVALIHEDNMQCLDSNTRQQIDDGAIIEMEFRVKEEEE
jgi:hypothetical protein